MKISYTLTADEYVDILKLHQNERRKNLWFAYVAFLLMLVMMNWSSIFSARFFITIFLQLSIVIIALKLFVPFIHKWQFKRSKLLQNKRTMSFEEESFSLETDLIKGFVKYEAVEKVVSNDDFLLIYISAIHFHIVPLRMMSNQDKTALLKLINKEVVK